MLFAFDAYIAPYGFLVTATPRGHLELAIKLGGFDEVLDARTLVGIARHVAERGEHLLADGPSQASPWPMSARSRRCAPPV